AAFRTFGVGTWQARTVPLTSGVAAVAFLIAGIAVLHGRGSALVAGTLLAVNYVSVMWNRAALMESTMTALIVISWSAYAMASRRSPWGAVAGLAAVLAFLTKASAAFFVAALAFDALTTLMLSRQRGTVAGGTDTSVAGATWTLIGLAIGAVAALALFAVPHWTEFRFYNWQMS